MNSFVYHVPTRVYFGRNAIEKLPAKLAQLGKNCLLVYGGGSIKAQGLYDKVLTIGEEAGISFTELSGVQPNPRVESVREGARLCKEKNIDVILAVGGGSVLDCAKVIAAAACSKEDAWALVKDTSLIQKALPVACILTLSATGSETDSLAVISNMETREKKGMGHPLIRPQFAILDPTYTYSVSPYQTAAGTADIYSHALEVYLNHTDGAFVANSLGEVMMKTCVRYGKRAVADPENYEARSNLMWAGSLAICDLLKCGTDGVAWSAHTMEHVLSAWYDVSHGAGLAVLIPHWLRHILSDETADKLAELAHNVWDVPLGNRFKMAREGIDRCQAYFTEMGLPARLRDMGIEEEALAPMAHDAATERMRTKTYRGLTEEDILAIYRAAW